MAPPLLRFAGFAAVVTLWSGLGAGALLSGFPLLGERPLSWMVADPASSTLFRTALLLGALLLVVFHGHVRARFPAGRGFSLAMLVGLGGQLVAAVVPIDGGPTANRVHTAAALTLGVSLPLLMWRFAASQPSSPWRRVAYGLFWAETAACATGVALSRSSVAPLAEIVPAAAFHLWILVLTVAPRRAPGSTARPSPRPAVAPRAAPVRSG